MKNLKHVSTPLDHILIMRWVANVVCFMMYVIVCNQPNIAYVVSM